MSAMYSAGYWLPPLAVAGPLLSILAWPPPVAPLWTWAPPLPEPMEEDEDDEYAIRVAAEKLLELREAEAAVVLERQHKTMSLSLSILVGRVLLCVLPALRMVLRRRHHAEST